MNIKNKKGFTLVELIIATTIFSIFIVIGSITFTSSISNIQYIKSLGEDQESMLYDNFMLDELLSNSKEIYEIKTNTNTGYLFRIDREKFNYSFASLDINNHTGSINYTSFAIKKFIPLNDIVNNNGIIVFSASGEGDIKKIDDGTTILSSTGILKNPTGLLSTGSELYISDTGNHCIRKLSNINNCFIGSIYPGTDNKSFISPTYMAINGDILYVSDTYNNKIRKVSLFDTGNIIDVFGDSTFGFGDLTKTFTGISLNIPTGIAFKDNFLYVSDTGNNRILKLDIITGSGEVFVGTGEDKTIFVSSGSLDPAKIPISHPTTLKIVGNKLYFLESISGVIKSITLDESPKINNEFGNFENIAYYGDFETDLFTHSTFGFDGSFSGGSIVGEEEGIIPYEGTKTLELVGTLTSNSGSFIYNFSGVTLKPAQLMDLSFYSKTLSGTFSINYGFTYNNNFVSNKYNTGILNESWNKFVIHSDFDINQDINGLKIDIFNNSGGLEGESFLIDNLKVNLYNINLTGNKTNKFENNFPYLGSFYIDGDNSYTSLLIDGKNYKFSINQLGPLEEKLYNFVGINFNNSYLFDDYEGISRLSFFDIDEVEYINKNHSLKILGLRMIFNTFNGYFLDKYISINN